MFLARRRAFARHPLCRVLEKKKGREERNGREVAKKRESEKRRRRRRRKQTKNNACRGKAIHWTFQQLMTSNDEYHWCHFAVLNLTLRISKCVSSCHKKLLSQNACQKLLHLKDMIYGIIYCQTIVKFKVCYFIWSVQRKPAPQMTVIKSLERKTFVVKREVIVTILLRLHKAK